MRIYSDLGRIWYEKLHRDRNALESWERVLDIDTAHTDALFAIAEIHRAAGSHSDLVDTLHRIIDVGSATLDDAAIEGVYMQLGAIFDEQAAAAARGGRGLRSRARAQPAQLRARWTRSSASTPREEQWEDVHRRS